MQSSQYSEKFEDAPSEHSGRVRPMAPSAQPQVGGRGASGHHSDAAMERGRGVSRSRYRPDIMLRTRPDHIVSKKGTHGTHIQIIANYFRVNHSPQWVVYKYRIDFAPDVEALPERRYLVGQHKSHFGLYLFDGTMLFSSNVLPTETVEFVSKNRIEQPVKITVQRVGHIDPFTDPSIIQVLNLVQRRCLGGLNLQLIDRNYFDPRGKIVDDQNAIELWPGYTTSIRQHEQDILLCVEIKYKVLRKHTLYQMLEDCRMAHRRDFMDEFKRMVIGIVVCTTYNNKTYRISDVNFDTSPRAKFQTKAGDKSFIDYYQEVYFNLRIFIVNYVIHFILQRYRIRINNPDQPLLVVKSRERDIRAGQTEVILLVPELCRPTGFTDTQMNDMQ